MNKNQKKTTLTLILIAIVLFAASWYVQEKQEDYRSAVQVNLAKQETNLVRFAGLISRESADAVVNQLVRDCEIEKRARFDELLGNLSILNHTELVEIEQLFDACGSYFADRQALLVARFAREVEIFGEYVALLELTSEDTRVYAKKIEQWSELLILEQRKSQLSLELVTTQDEIIELLLQGESLTSESMKEKVAGAQATKDTLSLVILQASELRAEVSGL